MSAERDFAPAERFFNIAMGVSVASWAVLPFVTAPDPMRELTAVRLSISALHIPIAAAFLTRTPLTHPPTTRELLAALPSLIVAGVAFRAAPHSESWPVWVSSVFVAGSVFTLWVLRDN